MAAAIQSAGSSCIERGASASPNSSCSKLSAPSSVSTTRGTQMLCLNSVLVAGIPADSNAASLSNDNGNASAALNLPAESASLTELTRLVDFRTPVFESTSIKIFAIVSAPSFTYTGAGDKTRGSHRNDWVYSPTCQRPRLQRHSLHRPFII